MRKVKLMVSIKGGEFSKDVSENGVLPKELPNSKDILPDKGVYFGRGHYNMYFCRLKSIDSAGQWKLGQVRPEIEVR